MVENRAGLVMPLEVRATRADGDTVQLPDVDRASNSWRAEEASQP